MHPAMRRPCTAYCAILSQSGKTVYSKVIRIYADKSNDIKIPPEPTTCCMSGCANCVWIEYAQTLSKLLDGNDQKVRDLVLSKISDPNLKMFLSLELRNLKERRKPETEIETRKD